MIPLAIPNLTGNEQKYLDECIRTTFVSSVGPFVERLEKDAAKHTGSVGAVATSSGTTALHTALMVSGVCAGDLVLVPSFTFIASANSIRHAGAYPWFVDVDPQSWCMDAEQVRRELATHCYMKRGICYHKALNCRVSAIMPVYTLGNIPNMEVINDVACEYNLAVIADAACAIGATWNNTQIGDLADLSAISLNGNKTITAGGGGIVCGMNGELIEQAKHLTTTARVWPDYDFDEVGYNYRLTNLQAAVACAQLERLDEFLKVKRRVRKTYDDAFANLDCVSPFPVPAECDSSCWFSGFVLEEGSVSSVVKALNELGVGAKAFWKPVHLQAPYANALRAGSLNVTEDMWSKIVTLPCSTNITDEELGQVIAATERVLEA